jgi:predicted nucleotidyltransferase
LRGEILKGPPQRLVILFGSRARGLARPDSDADVGILPVDPGLALAAELELQVRLSRVAGMDIDLVRLDGDNLLLGHEAALHGVAIYEDRAGAFARFRASATAAWLDFETSLAPVRERWLSRMARRGGH